MQQQKTPERPCGAHGTEDVEMPLAVAMQCCPGRVDANTMSKHGGEMTAIAKQNSLCAMSRSRTAEVMVVRNSTV